MDVSNIPESAVSSSVGSQELDEVAEYCPEKVTKKQELRRSVMSVRIAVFSSTVATTVLFCNAPFMVSPGLYPDSFPTTKPFGFNAATYFLEMSGYLGTAIASLFIGRLSDSIGRRPCLLVCLVATTLTTVIMFLVRHSFWMYCSASFVNGLFGATVPLATAYVSDISTSRRQKDAEISIILSIYMVAISAGGVATILLGSTGLFTPLFVGSGLSFISAILLHCFMVESAPCLGDHVSTDDTDAESKEDVENGGEDSRSDAGVMPEETVITAQVSDDESSHEISSDSGNQKVRTLQPAGKVNKSLFCALMVSVFLDNIGSRGLYPMVMSPLAFDSFYMDFVQSGQDPVLSVNGYRWIQVLLLLVVGVGAAMTDNLSLKIGKAGVFVLGAFVTALGILGCMFLAEIHPATKATLICFVIFLYVMYPFTVLSQLATVPMVDIVAPPHLRGAMHSLFAAVFNFTAAVSPWVLGTLADHWNTATALYVAAGVCVLAAVVGVSLMTFPELQQGGTDPPRRKSMDDDDHAEPNEEPEERPTEK